MKTAVVFLADGFEEVEALTPVDYLRRTHEIELFTVAVPSPTMNDKYIVTGSHNVPVIADMSFDEFKDEFETELPDLIFCPGGGPGSTNLAACAELSDFIKKCNEAGKYISAICAAPAAVLAKTGVLKGKEWTCYPASKNNLEQFCAGTAPVSEVLSGSKYRDDAPFVTDINIVTSRGAGTAEQFAMELVRLLFGSEKAKSIHDATIQR